MNKSRVDVLAVCALSVFLLLSVACGGSSSSARDTSQGDTSNVGDASAIDIVLGDLNNDPDHGDSFSDGAQMLLDHPLLTAFTPTGAGTYGVNPEQNTTASVCPSPLSPIRARARGFVWTTSCPRNRSVPRSTAECSSPTQ